MIRPEMDFRKNIQLSITDLDEARDFAEKANKQIGSLAKSYFQSPQFDLVAEKLPNGNFLYKVNSLSFAASFELVVGWDMQLHGNKNVKFMALNFSGDGYNKGYRISKKTLEKMPDYGYYGGMFAGGALGFAASMIYAVYTEALDATFYAVVMIIMGWLGSIVGKFIAGKVYNKRFDTVHVRAMDDNDFVQCAAKWLSFQEEIIELMKRLLAEDKAAARSRE